MADRRFFLFLECAVLLAPACFGQADALPRFAVWQMPVAPGLIASFYGEHLGPAAGCLGEADPQRHETPSPLRPNQTSIETSIYPTELCGVQVFVGSLPAGLLYVQDRQINFKTPQETPMTGQADLRVVYEGKSGAAVTYQLGFGTTTVSLASPAKVGMPVWLKFSIPPYYGGDATIRYPFDVLPANFKCHEIEVRRDGKLLTPIASAASQTLGEMNSSGLFCGSVSPASQSRHMGQLPLHLQYRFDQPGVYELRYTQRGLPGSEIKLQSEWTRFEVLPAGRDDRQIWLADMKAHAPSDAGALLDDFLPSLLGVPDDESLQILSEYLYHPVELVRRYAMYGLTYWPPERALATVQESFRTRGPSDVVMEFLSRRAPSAGTNEAIFAAEIPFLKSGDPVQLREAVTAIRRLLPAGSAGNELIAAADHVMGMADMQTRIDYCALLGAVRDERARAVLWRFINRNVAREQAAIALSWQHSPEDLPRLAELALKPPDGGAADHDLHGLAYALRRGYGDAALPYLETMLIRAESVAVRTQSALELMQAGKPSGFAYAADAIQNNRLYRNEILQVVKDRFPEFRQSGETAILEFLKARASVPETK